MEPLDDLKVRIEGHDVNIADLTSRTTGLEFVVFGDDKANFRGLLERQAQMDTALEEMSANWRDITVRYETILLFLRIGLILVGAIVAGVWLPALEQILRMLGG